MTLTLVHQAAPSREHDGVITGRAGCRLFTRRVPEDGRVAAGESVLLIWTPSAGAFTTGPGPGRDLRSGEYALVTGFQAVGLRPHGADRSARIHALETHRALIGDIVAELRQVSRSRIEIDRFLSGLEARPAVGPQPDWLVGLLADLDHAARLGLRDPDWLRRHARLVWERLVFSRAVHRATPSSGNARPRPSARRRGLEGRLRRVRRLLEEDYHRPLDLAGMAALACVSRYHFLREFHKAYGRTPYQLLLEFRLRAARRLLEESDLPVQEIGARVGFASTDGFYRAFRRRYRHPPSACRTTV
jgi:AraC-like DNA-binding protein